jgi:hypothetical protein
MKNKQKVIDFIEENFHVDQIKIEEYPLFPSGHLVTDSEGGQMVVYYDFLHDRIETVLPKK